MDSLVTLRLFTTSKYLHPFTLSFKFYRIRHISMTSNTSKISAKRWKDWCDSRFVYLFWVVCLVFGCLLVGCKDGRDLEDQPPRTLVVPLTNTLPYEYEGEIGRNWGGDEFEVLGDKVVHYVKLHGVAGPEPGQTRHIAARLLVLRYSVRKNAQVRVQARDESMSEVATIECGGRDLGLMLIENGLGWYDLSDCEMKEQYRAAEQKARDKKKGIWAQPNPTSPWVYRKEQAKRYSDYLKKSLGTATE